MEIKEGVGDRAQACHNTTRGARMADRPRREVDELVSIVVDVGVQSGHASVRPVFAEKCRNMSQDIRTGDSTINICIIRKRTESKNNSEITCALNIIKTSIATTKCLTSDDSAKKNTTEIPKLDNLKEANPFFSKYEAKLKKVYE